MRLSAEDVRSIVNTLSSYAAGIIYLHGSGVDDLARGGDIDLFFVIDPARLEELVKNKYIIAAELSLKLREQRVDLVIIGSNQTSSHSFFNNSEKLLLN